MNDIEALLESIACTIEQKVMYIAYRLSGEAKRWWQAKNVLLVLELGSEQAITWEIFKEEFHRHFFLQVVQGVKASKFMDLVQGSMTVTAYGAKFIQLSRFDVYLI